MPFNNQLKKSNKAPLFEIVLECDDADRWDVEMEIISELNSRKRCSLLNSHGWYRRSKEDKYSFIKDRRKLKQSA